MGGWLIHGKSQNPWDLLYMLDQLKVLSHVYIKSVVLLIILVELKDYLQINVGNFRSKIILNTHLHGCQLVNLLVHDTTTTHLDFLFHWNFLTIGTFRL